MQRLETESPGILPGEISSAELVRGAMSEARDLVRLEISLAIDELRRELVSARNAAIAFGVAAALAIVGVSLLFVAFGLAIFPGPIPSLVLGLFLVSAAAIVSIGGIKLLPKRPLAETRRRLETGIETVKDQLT
jgi:hypothetical protein